MSTGKRDLKALNPYPVDFIFSIKHGVCLEVGAPQQDQELKERKLKENEPDLSETRKSILRGCMQDGSR